MIVRLEGNIDDDVRDIIQMLHVMAPIHAIKTTQRWKLNCRECRYLGPWAAAILHAAFLEGTQHGQTPRIQLPERPPALKAFCVFSGMEKYFKNGPAPQPDHPECETIPIEQFSSASWDRADRLVRLLKRHTELEVEREDQLRTCVQEVTQNIVDHSESTIGGVFSARYIDVKKEVRVGIVDHGLGIAEVLRRRHADTRDSVMALNRVTHGGYSSMSRPNNMGIGVCNLFQIVKEAGGRIALFTGDALAESHGPALKPIVQPSGCEVPGTAVFFTLPVSA